MIETETLPFFERADDGVTGLPVESYVAGIRGSNDGVGAVRITLPAELVEQAVLSGAQLSIWLSASDGRLVLDGAGLDDKALEMALTAGPIREQTLLSLVEACLDPDHLAMEDDPVEDLTSLKAHLAEALAKVDGALTRLRG